MAEKMSPAFKILHLQLDAMLGCRRSMQEQLDKMDAAIAKTQTMIEAAEEGDSPIITKASPASLGIYEKERAAPAFEGAYDDPMTDIMLSER